ncbi:hypothetical protein HIMB11_00381 [Rhodobacteraceae bacterium HIMB11]|nr:hypothetical protein HIMB11_00381 [Rhodobacteraceae bacterium HIMB11]
MIYLSLQPFINSKVATICILSLAFLMACISTEIAWGQDYKVKHLQSKLTLSGFNPGPIDGFWGSRTASTFTKMLNENGIKITSVTKSDISKEALSALNSSYHSYSEKSELEIMHLQQYVDAADARHLLERTGLGAHPSEVKRLIGLTRSKAISHVLENLDGTKVTVDPPEFISAQHFPDYWIRWDYEESQRQAFRISRDQEMGDFRTWWVRELISTPNPQAERLLLLWHNHFVTAYSGVQEEVHAVAKQHWTMRELGHTNFRSLAKAMVRDPAMLNYLDNDRSRKEQPNENLARELMELFVLGEGNYTEKDVKEVARALTGYGYNRIRNLEFEFKPWDHDKGRKSILGQRGLFKGEQVVDILLSKPEAAEFVTKRFWNVYISEFNNAPEEVSRIATVFRDSEYDIPVLLRTILTSEHFWANENRATVVKSPVDLLIGTIRTTGTLPEWWPTLPNRLATIGQNLYEAPNVAGWPGGADWMTPSRLLLRNEMINDLLKADPVLPNSEHVQNSVSSGSNDSSMSSSEHDARVAMVRYAAENFKGPPAFDLSAIEDKQGKRTFTWSSKTIHAEGGIDTERFGRVDTQDLNWNIAKFTVPDNLSFDRLRITFFNDHCCGPGGPDGGDRNLFIDWVVLDNKLFQAAQGSQETCRDGNGDENPGRMYCSGWLELTQFEEIKEEAEIHLVSETSDESALQVERVAFEWGNSLSRADNWNNFTLGLLNPSFKDIDLDAMQIRIVSNRTDEGRRILLNIEDRSCYPSCLGGSMPRAAYKNRDNGALNVNFILSGPEWREEKNQWNQLTRVQKEFISTLWLKLPELLDAAMEGRNWRERNAARIWDDWSKVFTKVDKLLPKSRYARYASDQPINFVKSSEGSYMMMSMMSAVLDQTPTHIAGIPLKDADLGLWTENEGVLPVNKLVLATNAHLYDPKATSLSDLFTDPAYNLK